MMSQGSREIQDILYKIVDFNMDIIPLRKLKWYPHFKVYHTRCHEMIFLHLYYFLSIVSCFFLQSNERNKWTFILNIDTIKVWISYNIITVWCIQIIWFNNVDVWVDSITNPIPINVQNLPSLFPYWWRKRQKYLFYFCKIVPQYYQIKTEDWEDVQCHEHCASIDCVINIMIDSIVFLKWLKFYLSLY